MPPLRAVRLTFQPSEELMFSRTLACSFCALALSVVSVPAHAAPKNDNAQATIGNLIAALNNVNVQTGDITVVDGDILESVNVVALNNALNRNNIELFSGDDADVVDLDVQNVLNNLNIDVAVSDVFVLVDVLSGEIVGIILP
jgi:hypothetical protein